MMLLILNSSSGQGYFNKWYFGRNAGLDFNRIPPIPIRGEMVQIEGCASISDLYGNILFYTDGIRVWNANHQIMPNGKHLLGHWSSTQSALIVPNPGNTNQYYIFTTTWEAPKVFSYSIVDMTLDNGLGDVTSIKNIKLRSCVSEKATAIKIPDGSGFWILGHDNDTNTFFALKLTRSGIDSNIVISAAGSSADIQSMGYMKFSNKGDKIAMAECSKNFVELFSFDIHTGKVSHLITFDSYIQPYGVEFSPDDSLLYISSLYGSDQIIQIDLFAGDSADIIQSAQIIAYRETGFGAMQLAPDGKIYIAIFEDSVLAAINCPNAKGFSCGFELSQLSLLQGNSYLGLPNYYRMYWTDYPEMTTQKKILLCKGDSILLVASVKNTEYLWQDGSKDSVFMVKEPGIYWVKTDNKCGKTNDTFFVKYYPDPTVNLGNDTILCFGDQLILNASNDHSTYLWQDNSTEPTYSVSNSGTYWVRVTNKCVSVTDTINVKYRDCNCLLHIPNAFTPGSDGLNDKFLPVSNCSFNVYTLKIFNRWGEQIFISTDINFGWDGTFKGKNAPIGVYYGVLTGETSDNKNFNKHFTISLIR